MQGTSAADQLTGVLAGIGRIADAVGESTPHAVGIANLLWSSPVGMMVAQMVTSDPLPTAPEQHALAALIGEHLDASQLRPPSKAAPKAGSKPRSRRKSR